MRNEDFNEIFYNTMKKCESVLISKGSEYSLDYDRLHNFQLAKQLMNSSAVNALGGMMVKHTVSVYDYVDRYERGENITLEQWDEKIIDSMNYLILLRAVLIEENADDWGDK